jgi:hypothetical protein
MSGKAHFAGALPSAVGEPEAAAAIAVASKCVPDTKTVPSKPRGRRESMETAAASAPLDGLLCGEATSPETKSSRPFADGRVEKPPVIQRKRWRSDVFRQTLTGQM